MENEDLSEKNLRKNLPLGITGTGGMREHITPLYDEKKLDFRTIRDNPVLKPLAEINNGFVNMELLINRALWEFQEDKTTIDEMIEINPKYSETMILSKFQSLLGHVKQIIQAQDIQKENMKRAINEMVRIVDKEYGVLNEEGIDAKDVKPKEAQQDNLQINEENKEIENEGPVEFPSELLERDIPIPVKKIKKEEIAVQNKEIVSETDKENKELPNIN